MALQTVAESTVSAAGTKVQIISISYVGRFSCRHLSALYDLANINNKIYSEFGFSSHLRHLEKALHEVHMTYDTSSFLL